MRLELPDGAWAEIRDPRKITRGARKPIRAATLKVNKYRQDLEELADQAGIERGEDPYIPSEDESEMLDHLSEVLTVALVESWSFDLPITVDGINDLPTDAADDLISHCFGLFDKVFEMNNPEPTPDRDSPTTP